MKSSSGLLPSQEQPNSRTRYCHSAFLGFKFHHQLLLFAMVYSKTGRYFSMQLAAQLAAVPPISHVLLFRVRNKSCPGSLVARGRCIRADVQNTTPPRLLTPLAICTGTPGLHSQSEISCRQSLSDHLVGGCVRIAPRPASGFSSGGCASSIPSSGSSRCAIG